MPNSVDIVQVQSGHNVIVPRRAAKGWLSANKEYSLAPLDFRRSQALGVSDRLHAWTLFADDAHFDNWEINPMEFPGLVFNTRLYKHPSGWKFAIPKHLRNLDWLPKAGEKVVREILPESEEVNIWVPRVYNTREWLRNVQL